MKIVILGIRGIPARHGGFETFVENLCQFLVKKNWSVTVYCQEDGLGGMTQSNWRGVNRIHIPVNIRGPLGTIMFDFKSVIHSLTKQKSIYLILGYNTACFNLLYRVLGRVNIINMDGIEWKRQKWGKIAKMWLLVNEQLGCRFGSHLISDHPNITDHLSVKVSRDKITMIPYGALDISSGNESFLIEYGLEKNKYSIVIARPEPENSFLEIVTSFSSKKRGTKLVVLGDFQAETNPYHKAVIESASEDVIFLGAIYDTERVSSLRYFSRFIFMGIKSAGQIHRLLKPWVLAALYSS